MTVPDAKTDLVATIQWIAEQTTKNAEELERIKKAIGLKETMGIPELAARWGISASSIRSDLVKQPNYGRPDIGRGRKTWFIATVEEWERRSEEERRDLWDRMTADERRKYLGLLECPRVERRRRRPA